MPKLVKLLTTFGSATFLAILLSATVYTSNTNATSLNLHADEQTNNIRIYHEQNKQNRVYEVNGKKFYWNDLSPKHQQKLSIIEEKITKAEKRIRIREVEMRPVLAKLESKAKALEKEMQKIELATIKLDKTELNMHDVDGIMKALEAVANVDEKTVRLNQLEMEKLTQQLDSFDTSFSDEIEQHVAELETVLVAIAQNIN
jgi:hypothetical protein